MFDIEVYKIIPSANTFCSILLIASVFLGFIRFFKGPDTLNRIIALDLISISLIGMVVVFSEQESSNHYIELILIFCLLGFATAVVLTESLFRVFYQKEEDD